MKNNDKLIEIFRQVIEENTNHSRLTPKQIDAINNLKIISIDEFDWNWIVKQPKNYFSYYVKLMYKLIDLELFKGEMLYGIKEHRDVFENNSFMLFSNKVTNLEDSLPHNFFTTFNNKKTRLNLVVKNISHGFSKLFKTFLEEDYYKHGSLISMCEYVFKGCQRKRLLDFNDATFLEDAHKAFEIDKTLKEEGHYTYNNAFTYLVKFYVWVQNTLTPREAKRNFKKFSLDVLGYTQLSARLKENYSVVNYSLFDKPPVEDKLILRTTNVKASIDINNISSIDFTQVENPVLRSLVKEFFWSYRCYSVNEQIKLFYRVFDFCNFIDDTFIDDEIKIDNRTILMYRSYLFTSGLGQKTICACNRMIKNFLNFLIDKKKFEISVSVFDALGHTKDDGGAYKDAFTQNEIELLDAAYKEALNHLPYDYLYTTYYLAHKVFQLMRYSEIRKASILNLRVDSLIKVLGEDGHCEYKLVVPSKTSGVDDDEYNITMKVKHIFDDIIEVTKEIRAQAPKNLQNVLFITISKNHKLIKNFSDRTFCDHHEKMCKEAGVDYKPGEAIRNYYMQSVTDFVEKEKLPIITIEALGKHSRKVHEEHYIRHSIEAVAERVFKVNIGDFNFEGEVIEADAVNEERKVENGYCGLNKCNVTTLLHCIKCPNFRVTPDSIPELENAIKLIDEQIVAEKITHEKEFKIVTKELLVKCLEEILVYKETHRC